MARASLAKPRHRDWYLADFFRNRVHCDSRVLIVTPTAANQKDEKTAEDLRLTLRRILKDKGLHTRKKVGNPIVDFGKLEVCLNQVDSEYDVVLFNWQTIEDLGQILEGPVLEGPVLEGPVLEMRKICRGLLIVQTACNPEATTSFRGLLNCYGGLDTYRQISKPIPDTDSDFLFVVDMRVEGALAFTETDREKEVLQQSFSPKPNSQDAEAKPDPEEIDAVHLFDKSNPSEEEKS